MKAVPSLRAHKIRRSRRHPSFLMAGVSIEVVDSGHDAVLEFLFGCDADMAQHRATERASLEQKPSTRLSHEPCLGVKVNSKRPIGWSASQALVSFEMCAE